MRRPKFSPGTADDTETAFYDALQHGDLERLMECWADEDDIVCVHPGGERLVGHAAIRAAFESLFAHGSVKVRPERVRRIDAGGCSVHSVVERVDVMGDDGPANGWIMATNVYAKTVHGWRMVTHHASPGSGTEPVDTAASPSLLH
ncbi:YybH family protein [Hydrogenophaga sp. MI9]|uniref:YybH family protein n=1 Tax=Hydrogenophaga sp. MI9 TaxID=3453719 RepID=UPI003EE862F0